MQNKGAITLLAVALALVSLYQLFFTYKTNQVENAAKEFANGNPIKEKEYLDSVANQPVYNFLGLAKFTYKECKELELNLGLDLKGGMNVTMEVDVVDVVKSLANHSTDPAFNQAIEEAVKMRVSSPKDFVTLFGEAFEKIAPGAQLASPAIFGTHEMKEKIKVGATNKEVLDVIRKEADGAIDNTFNILRTRIDRFGVAQPNIRKADISGRIVIELPGIKEPQRVRELLQGTAALEFYETFDNAKGQDAGEDAFINYLAAADQKLKEVLDAQASKVANEETTAQVTDTTKVQDKESAILDAIKGESDSLKTVTSMAEYEKEHPLLAILSPNMTQQGQPVGGSTIGYANIKDTAKINAYLRLPQVKAAFPRNARLLWEMKAVNGMVPLHAIKITTRNGKAPLEGDAVIDARQDYDQQGRPVVSMQMNGEGTKTWARLTKDNIGRCIAIVLDGMVASSPNVNDEIKGGSSQISGRFDVKEAGDLANILKSGKLPAPARIIADEVVGASLGQEAIQSGMWSFIIAFVLVLAYMLFFYSKNAGLAADIALLANLFFLFGILASIGAVLTLPGIAGIVLTMGMAVDANVLIYERTKEELRAGKSLNKAIADGYSNAFSAIFDSNLTSIITGVVLFYFGTGPIRGFATTMIIGLFASFLTAVFLTRIVYEALLAKDKLKNVTFTTSITKDLLTNPKINFLAARKVGYLIPAGIIVLGAISMSTIGLNNGIDFTGGRNYVIRFAQDVKTDEVRNLLDAQLDGSVSVIQIGTPDQVRVSTNYKIEDNDPAIDQEIENKLFEGVKSLLPEGTTLAQFTDQYIQSSQKVGPSMADDIKNAAFLAVVFAMFCMAAYILLRFRDISFSVGAFASVAVTTLCIISFYTLLWKVLPFSMEVDQTFIAAILTIIGYSINDTVVVFDRIRETIGLYPKRDRYQVINDALNSTLSRTFNTSLTTLVVVLCIFILGGATIRSFTFAILLGIIIGTYSTLFVATPIAYELQKKKINKKAAAEAGK